MAQIELGPLIENIQGTLGGTTFRRVGGKHYATQKSPGPLRPGKNSAQQFNALTQAANAWLQLDADIKNFWFRYWSLESPKNPKTGKPFISAYAFFTAYQLHRLHMNAAMLLDAIPPPPVFEYAEPVTCWIFKPDSPSGVSGGMIPFFATPLPDYTAIYITRMKAGSTTPRDYKKLFPLMADPSAGYYEWSDWLVWRALGYPPGITTLETQPAPTSHNYFVNCFTLYDDVIYWARDFQCDLKYWFVYPPIIP